MKSIFGLNATGIATGIDPYFSLIIFNIFLQGLKVYQNMSKCKENIEKDCSISLTAEKIDNIEKCSSVMKTFKTGVEICLKSKNKTGCDCWTGLTETLSTVKNCADPGTTDSIIKKKKYI
jgi:hypothetical protein